MTSLADPIVSDRTTPAPAEREGGGEAGAARKEHGRGIADMAILTIYGILQHQYGRHDDALESCSAVARACPGYPPAHAGRARALVGLGRPDEALHAFCDAIACDPGCAPAHADYALAVTRMGCYEDAVAAYGEAIRLAPDRGDVHAGHAFALAGAGRLGDALAACEKAVRLEPESALAYAAHGRVLVGMGRPSDALSAFDRAAGLDAGSASAHAGRGLALESLGRHAEALSAYGRAVRLDPASASAHAGRGLALESLGRHAEALSAYGRAIDIDRYHELALAGRDRTGRRCARGKPSGAGQQGLEGSKGRAGDQVPGFAPPGRRSACAAGIDRAMDPDQASARGYMEYCLSHAPRAGGRTGSPRQTPLTKEEADSISESASGSKIVEMDGSEFVDMIRGWAGTAERSRCDGA